MSHETRGLCRMWDICHFLYLTPMTKVNLGKRLFPNLTYQSQLRTFHRFMAELKESGIELHSRVDYDVGAHVFEYWITDPFWRDKLEMKYGIREGLKIS